jgi:hypothetical protein
MFGAFWFRMLESTQTSSIQFLLEEMRVRFQEDEDIMIDPGLYASFRKFIGCESEKIFTPR